MLCPSYQCVSFLRGSGWADSARFVLSAAASSASKFWICAAAFHVHVRHPWTESVERTEDNGSKFRQTSESFSCCLRQLHVFDLKVTDAWRMASQMPCSRLQQTFCPFPFSALLHFLLYFPLFPSLHTHSLSYIRSKSISEQLHSFKNVGTFLEIAWISWRQTRIDYWCQMIYRLYCWANPQNQSNIYPASACTIVFWQEAWTLPEHYRGNIWEPWKQPPQI